MSIKDFIAAFKAILRRDEFEQVDGHAVITEADRAQLLAVGVSAALIDRMNDYLANPGQGVAAGESNPDARMAVVVGLLNQCQAELESQSAELEKLRGAASADAATIAAKEAHIKELNEKIGTLSALPDHGADAPAAAAGAVDDGVQLFGRAGADFALSRPYNQRARAALLAMEGRQLVVNASSAIDYRTLNEDLGAFYRRPWRERLQSYLSLLPNIESIFELEGGHQHLDTLTSLWLGEFSQPENTVGSDFDKLVKGKVEFGTETLLMYGVSFVFKFTDLKALEKSWIGSLNREGSQAIKWSFIEYILAEVSKKLHNEQQQRYVNGIRKDPDPNVPGRALEAADGLYEYIRKRIDGHVDLTPNGGVSGKTVYQVKPFVLGRITPGNIGEVLYQGTSMIPSHLRDRGDIVCYLPSYMIPWYHKYNELHYGVNQDYKPDLMCVKEFPNVKIVAVPNADGHHRVIWTFRGNIKTYCQVKGEMLNFSLEQQDWSLKVWSLWKESIQAEVVGFKYTDRAAMDGTRQLVWANEYDLADDTYVESAPDANPDVTRHGSVITVENSGVFAITDIIGAEVGQTVRVKCGVGGDHGVKIVKAGVFELLTADWVPAAGEVLTLMKRADGKFVELSRDVAAATALRIAADVTEPDLTDATVFMTSDNTGATAITGFKGMTPGVVYTVYGAGGANASTMANGGKFMLTADMTLSAGKFIRLVATAAGTICEVERG